ncbi:TorF family putative porin [Xanthobacter sp. V0B-10]|uniref:TorF family putative porin n=1 Tax=Xanthobacter albus TaxID=3119929 RepID=UPI003728EF03
MKKIALVAASMLIAGSASAADLTMPVKAAPAPEPTPVWDLAFGAKLTSDYIFRGMTQTNGDPAVQGYAELRLFDWVYGGLFMSSVNFPAVINNYQVTGLTDPSAEMDIYGGLRHTWGGLTLDVGYVYYYYPGQLSENSYALGVPAANMNYWEVYFKPTYVINDIFTVGANLYYSSNYVGTGSDDTYLSGTLKVDFSKWSPVKDVGFYVSGEVGYQWLGTTNYSNIFVANYELPSYTTWNVGAAFTYKAATLDLRYYGSDLSEGYLPNGSFNTCGQVSGLSNACGDRFVASLSIDTSLNALK